MLNMVRVAALLVCISGLGLLMAEEKPSQYPSFPYDVVQTHEIKPHRRSIPVDGVSQGTNQLHLKLIVSPTGDVIHAEVSGEDSLLKYWPALETEVFQWKFIPFKEGTGATTVEIEEYVDLVPPEKLPTTHVPPPVIRPDSQIEITLQRYACYGSCPSYQVDLTTHGIVFDGHGFVVANGKHIASIDTDAVRALAKKFVEADFYSMASDYRASVTDMPSYELSISIDGQKKEINDYVGQWVGMPSVVKDLEDEVDQVANTERWVNGDEGLVQVLEAEKFNFETFEAQVLLKGVASRGQIATVKELLLAGVSLKPLPAPKPKEPYMSSPFENIGWLSASSNYPEVINTLIEAGASKDDQKDKDSALVGAANSGNVLAAKELIAYGANPNANLSKLTITQDGGISMSGKGAGSILIYAASSGNPEMVREILRYHPRLEARDREGKTAMFAAGDYRNQDEDGARVECVRILAQAGANVNARDDDGNTPLHETFLTDMEEELLKLGADVNARNHDGETPIFTTVDDNAVELFIKHGADLTIRNKEGQTVVEAAKEHGPLREEALRKAMQESNNRYRSRVLHPSRGERWESILLQSHQSGCSISCRVPILRIAALEIIVKHPNHGFHNARNTTSNSNNHLHPKIFPSKVAEQFPSLH
jgi:ankyrin repeat protein